MSHNSKDKTNERLRFIISNLNLELERLEAKYKEAGYTFTELRDERAFLREALTLALTVNQTPKETQNGN